MAELATSVFVDDPHLAGDDPAVAALDAVLTRRSRASEAKRYAGVAELTDALLPALGACPTLARGAVEVRPRKGQRA